MANADEKPQLSSRQRKIKAKQLEQQAQTVPSTPLRATELYFKNRLEDPDWAQAFSAEAVSWEQQHPDCGTWKDERVRRICSQTSEGFKKLPGCGVRESFDALLIDSLPGLVYLPNLLSPQAQRELVKCALRDGPRRPNTTSLDVQYKIPPEGLWQAFHQDPSSSILKKKTPKPAGVTAAGADSGQRRAPCNLRPIDEKNFSSERAQERDFALGNDAEDHRDWTDTRSAAEVLDKLRWASIGMAYHWGTKTYIEGIAPPIPSMIHCLCQEIVRSISWSEVLKGHHIETASWNQTYEPQGGIINFYNERDSLTSHIDHSEADTERPLVSISLGLTSVFVAGGRSRDERKPVPFLLKSGDVILMSGPSRRIYHGVPRVLKSGTIDQEQDEEWEKGGFVEYMRSHRVNLNVRQVHHS